MRFAIVINVQIPAWDAAIDQSARYLPTAVTPREITPQDAYSRVFHMEEKECKKEEIIEDEEVVETRDFFMFYSMCVVQIYSVGY